MTNRSQADGSLLRRVHVCEAAAAGSASKDREEDADPLEELQGEVEISEQCLKDLSHSVDGLFEVSLLCKLRC